MNFFHLRCSMIERHHLAIIKAISQYGSLTKAADHLCLTQSALSHSIKKLEYQLGSKLWQIKGRNIQLLVAGEKILRLAERLLPQFEHTEQELKKITAGIQGTLRIGMECYPCYQWLIKVVGPFLKQYPDVDVDIHKAFQFGGIGAILAYDIDLLITPDPIFKKSLNYIPILNYELVLVVSKQHPLAQTPWILPEHLANEDILTYPVEQSRLDLFSQFIIPAGVSIKTHKTIENMEIMMQLVNANRGITALPYWLAKEYQQQLSIETVKIGKQGLNKCLYIGVRANDEKPQYFEQFIQLAKETADY